MHTAGRRPKPAADQPERFVVDDEEVKLRPPPKKKAREQKRGHDLMASVAQNKPAHRHGGRAGHGGGGYFCTGPSKA